MKNEQNGAEKIISFVGSIAEVLGVFYTQLTQHGLKDTQALALTNQLLNIFVDFFLDEWYDWMDDRAEDDETESEEEEE